MQVRCLPSILIATSPVGRVVILPSASSTAIEFSMATCRLSSVLVGRHVCSDPVSTIVSISRKSPPSLFPTRIVATISPMESPLLVPPARQSPRVHGCPIISPPEGRRHTDGPIDRFPLTPALWRWSCLRCFRLRHAALRQAPAFYHPALLLIHGSAEGSSPSASLGRGAKGYSRPWLCGPVSDIT